MISQANNPLAGARYLLQGMGLITRPGLRRFVLVPLMVNILIFGAAIYAGIGVLDRLITGLETRLPAWLGWLDWLLWPLAILFMLVILFSSFALVANLIASPFNALLAEKVERLLTGRSLNEGTNPANLLVTLLPTLLDEVKKLLYALILAIPFLLLLFIPVIGQILWFLYVAWILVVQYADYPMGNHGLKFREMRQRLARQPGMSLGFGAAAGTLSMLPFVNFILMPSAVAGATAMWVRELKGTQHYQGPAQSRVATSCVLLLIDHLSGRISGEVRAGPHQGLGLDQIATEDLLEMLAGCYLSDPDSAEAIEVYLERERDIKPAAPMRPTPDQTRPAPAAPMHPDEARAILGLTAQASAQETRDAHRRLIQRLHPDRGGSHYLAAKINEAKRILLSRE